MLKIKDLAEAVPQGIDLKVQLAQTRLIDLTVLEFLEDFGRRHTEKGGSYYMEGLKNHVASTDHPLALKSRFSKTHTPLNQRQKRIMVLAKEHNWSYQPEVEWNTSYLQNFNFFQTKPIEKKVNMIKGQYEEEYGVLKWEIADITFDEGAMLATEVYQSTIQVIRLPFNIPGFVLQKEDFFDKIFDRIMALSGQEDVDFQLFPQFSKRFILKAENQPAIRSFFTVDLIRNEITKMLHFSEQLLKKLPAQKT